MIKKIYELREEEFMNLSALRNRKWNYSALAFLFPCVGMLTVMLFSHYTPFGKYSMLYSDMFHQYYPFFVVLRNTLRQGGSLLYNWSIGMGIDFLGLYSYYLASPLNLLSVLVPEKLLLPYFSLMMPIKLGLAGLFFSIFLKKIFHRDDFSISVFGGFYGLCAWALGFQWNVMWLDTFALLPLVVLGMVSLLRERKFFLYTLTLFLAVVINYYIGLFVCFFVAMAFFCYEICCFPGWKRFFADLARIALFSAIAIGMTLFLTLPTVAALRTTQSGVNNFPTGFRLNIASENTWKGLLDAMRQVAGNTGGSIKPNFKEGLPNLYCGVGTLLLAFLYLLSGKVSLREKLCSVFLLIFFCLSFIIRQLDYIWHGFHFTNMIPYRFSFLFCFVLLYMAYRAWVLRKSFRPYQLVSAGMFAAAMLCCSNELMETVYVEFWEFSLDIPVFALYNFIFLAGYFGILFYGMWRKKLPKNADRKEQKEAQKLECLRQVRSRAMALGLVCVELAATLTSFALYFPGTNISNYPKGTEDAASMFRYMNKREWEPFFRAETTHSQTLNDGALNGYNGISAFTSSANVKNTEFMRALGYGAKNTYNRYCFEESSPVANLFLGLKYMVDRDGKDKTSTFFQKVHHFGNIYLYKNNAYLPLGFLTDAALADVDFFNASTPFTLQNTLFSASTGIDANVWYSVPGDSLVLEGNGTVINDANNGFCKYDEIGTNATVNCSFTADRAGFVCIYLDFPKRNDFTVHINGVELYRENISLPQMLAVGDVKPGDVVEIRAICKTGEPGSLNFSAAILDNTLFLQGYEKLARCPLELTEFRDTYVEGIITCDRDGLLYTSIPQNGNWSVRVDGKPAQIRLVGGCMVGVELTQGEHTVAFRYHNRAFTLGLMLSLACTAVFLGLSGWVYKPELVKELLRRITIRRR